MKTNLHLTAILIVTLMIAPFNMSYTMPVQTSQDISYTGSDIKEITDGNIYSNDIKVDFRVGAGFVTLGISPFGTWHISPGMLIDETPVTLTYIYGKEGQGLFNNPVPKKELSVMTIASGYCHHKLGFLYSIKSGIGYFEGIGRGKELFSWRGYHEYEEIRLSSACIPVSGEIGFKTGVVAFTVALDVIINKYAPLYNYSINMGFIF